MIDQGVGRHHTGVTLSLAATVRATPPGGSRAPTDCTATQHRLQADLEGLLIVDSVHARLFGDEQPTRIGKYIILRKIGGGGMADVYLGWHEDLERSDAIKLVHPGAQDSVIERKRLLREAQALARLTHENVIRVHDSGTHHDRVYIAMEYVKGCTLAAWQKGKPWREILGAYLKAGCGLQAAHAVALDDEDRPGSKGAESSRHGLVHRDFKPDNVLIGEDGRVRVADFGLAVPVERLAAPGEARPGAPDHPLDVRLTSPSALLGTPLYISPEQLRGEPADARSDQFSFCVALYEALYQQHPFYVPNAAGRDSGAATDSQHQEYTAPPYMVLFDAVLHAPLRGAPRGSVPRRIFQVLARGLQRDPNLRYPTMGELLADLERDPRRRTAAIICGLGGLGLAAGLVHATLQPPAACVDASQEVADVWNDARRGEVCSAFLATNVPYAASSFDAVDRALTRYLAAWTRSREQACQATYLHGTYDLALHERSMACLDQRRQLARTMIDELTRIEPGTLAGVVDRLGALPRIEDCDDRVLLRQTCTVEPSDPGSRSVLDALHAARAAELSGRYQEAESVAAVAVRTAVEHDVPALTARALFIHARILAELSRPKEAIDALLAAQNLAEGAECEGLAADVGTWIAKVVALSPAIDAQIGVAWSHYSFAKLRRLPHDRLRRADALSDRGLLRERQEEDAIAAEQDYRDALALREQDPEHSLAARAVNYLNLGSALHAQGRHEAALAALRTSLDLHRDAYGDGHPALWKPLFNIGLVATEAQQFDDAEQALTQALGLAQHAFGPGNRKVVEARAALTALFLDSDRGEPAREQAQLSLALCEQEALAAEGLCLDVRRLLAHSLELLGEQVEALELREQVLSLVKAPDPRLEEAHVELAASLLQLGRWESALEHTSAALANLDSDSPIAGDASLYHGEALLGLGRHDEAIEPLERALSGWSDGPAAARGRAAWALARGLCGAGHSLARARELASEVRSALASAGDDPEAAQLAADIDIWMNKPCPTRPPNQLR